MTDYADYRKRYVAEVRNSFEEDHTEQRVFQNSREETEAPDAAFFYTKLRAGIAICLFAAFFYLFYTGETIVGYDATDIINMIEDNHYYAELQKYITEDGANYEQ